MILTPASIEAFLNSISVNGGSDNTVRGYRADLKSLLATTGSLDVTELEVPAAKWLTAGRKTWAPTTTRRKSAAVRAWARWAGCPGFLGSYRLPNPGKPVPHPIPEGMEGVARMLDACGRNFHNRALVTLVCKVGMRVSEAISVTLDDFNVVDQTVTTRVKGDKVMVRPVPASCWPDLAPVLRGAAFYPPGEPVLRMKDRWARQVFTALGKKAGLSGRVATHDGRATFATHVYRVTKDLRVVQELLGHANAQTTQVYTEVGISRMKEAVAGAIG